MQNRPASIVSQGLANRRAKCIPDGDEFSRRKPVTGWVLFCLPDGPLRPSPGHVCPSILPVIFALYDPSGTEEEGFCCCGIRGVWCKQGAQRVFVRRTPWHCPRPLPVSFFCDWWRRRQPFLPVLVLFAALISPIWGENPVNLINIVFLEG